MFHMVKIPKATEAPVKIQPVEPAKPVEPVEPAMSDAETLRLASRSIVEMADILRDVRAETRNAALNSSNLPKLVEDTVRVAAASGSRTVPWAIGTARWLAIAALFAFGLWLGYMIRDRQHVATPYGPMSDGMAHLMRLQNMDEQFTACRAQPPSRGIEWCLLPFVTKIQPVGKE